MKPCCLIKMGILTILLSWLIPCNPTPFGGNVWNPIFQKGMAFPTWTAWQYSSAASDESLKALAQTTCTEYVQFVPTWYQEDRRSNTIFPDYEGKTARMDSLRHGIQTARHLGLRVMLKPHVDAISGDWRGTFLPENPETWFKNYRGMVKTYSQVAEEEGVDIFCVGCELVELTTPNYSFNWRELIQEIRNVFSGQLVYAANWGRESLQVDFWDALDFIGIDAYYELTDKSDPTIEDLIFAWHPFVSEIESIHLRWQKPVLITEIGYRSMDGANQKPWDWQASGEADMREQALCYDAVMKVFGEKSWFYGIYWWNWEPDPFLGGPTDSYYTPQGKTAEVILKKWYCNRKRDRQKKRPKIKKL